MTEEKSRSIIYNLKRNFLAEKKVIQDNIVEAETQIRQINDYIESLSKKDDCDYNVFSPRSASSVYKDRVEEKKQQILEIEEQIREMYKELSKVTKQLDSLNELQPESFVDVKKEETVSSSPKDNSLLLELQEDDRQRIAADLHDTVLQNLTLVMHNLELSSKFIDYDPIRAKLEIETNRKLVRETIDEIRTTIYDLRPMQFDDFGFKRTIENQINNYRSRTNIEISCDIDELENISNIYLITVFRVTQELMINAIKHSHGTKMFIAISRNESSIKICVSDNGIGMPEGDIPSNHFGLKILGERVKILGGSVKVESSQTKGTQVCVEIPV